MASRWYYKVMGEELGPVSATELRQLAQRGVLDLDAPVRNESSDWVSAGKVRGLFPPASRSPAPLGLAIKPKQPKPQAAPPQPANNTSEERVVTIELTSKKWKKIQLSGCLISAFSFFGLFLAGAFLTETRNSSAFSGLLSLLLIGGLLFGLVRFLYGRFGAWWHHG